MKHTVVYVPVETKYRIAYKEDTTLVNYLESSCHMDNNSGIKIFTPAQTFEINNFCAEVKNFLEPKNNIHLFTEEELLEQKRKWMEEAWEAGGNYASEYDYCVERGAKFDETIPDKQTFLNSIKL